MRMGCMDINNKSVHMRKSFVEVTVATCESALITLLTGRFTVLDIISKMRHLRNKKRT